MILAYSGVVTIMQVSCIALFYVESALQPTLFHLLGTRKIIYSWLILLIEVLKLYFSGQYTVFIIIIPFLLSGQRSSGGCVCRSYSFWLPESSSWRCVRTHYICINIDILESVLFICFPTNSGTDDFISHVLW